MDIGEGLKHLALMFVLIVLGSVVATVCLVGLVLVLIMCIIRAVRWQRRPVSSREPGRPDS